MSTLRFASANLSRLSKAMFNINLGFEKNKKKIHQLFDTELSEADNLFVISYLSNCSRLEPNNSIEIEKLIDSFILQVVK